MTERQLKAGVAGLGLGAARVVREMEAGNIPTKALRTHSGPLDCGPELFREWVRPDTGVIKAILEL